MTYAELVALIQSYTEYSESDFVATIPDFVRNAEERIYRSVQLPAGRKEATGSCVVGDEELTVPSDHFWPLSLSLTISSVKTLLLNKEPDWLIEAYGAASNGVPLCYAMKSDTKFMLAPKPGDTYTYIVTYHGLPTSIVSASTSWLGTHARNALLYGSLVEAGIFMRQDTEVIQAYELKYQEALQQLAEQGNYRIRKDTFRRRDARPDQETA